jgi:hypothetical protein
VKPIWLQRNGTPKIEDAQGSGFTMLTALQ